MQLSKRASLILTVLISGCIVAPTASIVLPRLGITESGLNTHPSTLSIADGKDEYKIRILKDRLAVYSLKGKRLAVFRVADNNSHIVSSCIYDLDDDRNDEVLLLIGKNPEKYGETLVILSGSINKSREAANFFKEIYRHTFKGLNPWKVQACDVDGDTKKEISLGVYKTAYFHPVPAKRPFIYNWTGAGITPKWLGSRLSRSFDDYIFADINTDGRDELISIETLKTGEKVINSYSWKGFGFEGVGESEKFNSVTNIYKVKTDLESNYEICAHVEDKKNSRQVVLELRDGALKVKK